MSSSGTEGVRVLLAGEDRAFLGRVGEALAGTQDAIAVEVVTAVDDALDSLAAERFDALVCTDRVGGGANETDGRDGLAVVSDATAQFPHLVTVWLTDERLDAVAADAVAAGVTAYLPRTDATEQYERLAERLVDEAASPPSPYRELFEKATDAIFLHDPETGEILDANPQASEMTGFDHDELVGATVSDFSAGEPPYTETEARRRITEAASEGSLVFEWKNRHKSGDTFWSEISLRRTDIGGEDRVLAIARDVTERKRREREYEQIFNMAGDGITIHDPDTGDLLDANQQIADLLGYDREDFLDRPMSDFFALDEGVSESRARELIRESFQQGGQEFEWPLETADGDTVWTWARHEVGEIGGEERVVALLHDVTERKRREREYEQIFDSVNDAIAVHDPTTHEMIDVNQTMCDLTGYDRETVLDLDVGGLSAEALGFSQDRADEVIDQVMAGDDIGPYEWAVETADGERVWLEVNATRATINGEPRFLAISRDITERKRAEQTYRETFENVADGLVVHDPETGEILDVNERYCRMNGYDRDELVGADVSLVTAGEAYSYGRAKDRIEQAETEGPQLFEWRNERKDGTEFPVEVHLGVVHIAGEERVLASVRDITERRRQERLLREFAERVDAVIAIFESPEMTALEYLSPGYEDVWGRPVEDVYEDPSVYVEGIHPDDRERYLEQLTAMREELTDPDADARNAYTWEYRVERPDGDVRWVETRAYPVRDETGTVYRFITMNRDVTDRKRREQTFESFNDATRQLTEADTRAAACEIAVDAGERVLGFAAVTAFLYDDAEGALEAVARSSWAEERLDPAPTITAGDRAWQVFVEGDAVKRTDRNGDGVYGDVDDVPAELLLPLGSHGVLALGTGDESGFDVDDIDAAQILAARLEAGLNHVEGERQLAERERELEAETARADRLDRLNTVIRDIEQALVDQSTREGVESTVCDRLTAGDSYTLAWIGGRTIDGQSLTVRNRSGDRGRGTPVDVVIEDATIETHPAWQAIDARDLQVVENLVDDRSQGAWRTRALNQGYQSCCAVPLTYDDVVHGVLTLYAAEPGAFDERERRVLDELGRSIGYAITTIERKRALESDAAIELEFEVESDGLYFVSLAKRTGGTVEHVRTVRNADGGVSLYCTLAGAAPDADDLDGYAPTRDVRVVTDREDECLLEVSADDWFGALFANYGAVIDTARASDGTGTLTVELPRGANVRTVVERFEREYPAVDLAAKRETEGGTRTLHEVRDLVDQQLTDRQREVLETAHAAGYFEWPRESSGEDVAAMLDITQPTFNRHLRLAEERTFSMLLDA